MGAELTHSQAINRCEDIATELSRFVAEVYDE